MFALPLILLQLLLDIVISQSDIASGFITIDCTTTICPLNNKSIPESEKYLD
jgi:hypothetical protein